MSRASEYANSVSSLYAQIGEARAREAANKGQIWSGALANIGDFVAQYPERKAKMEEITNRAAMTDLEKQRLQHQIGQETRDADEDQKIRDLFTQTQNEWQAGHGIVSQSDGVRISDAIAREKAAGTYQTPDQRAVRGPDDSGQMLPMPPAPTGQTRTSPIPTPSEILRTVSPKKAIALINGLAALKQDPQDDPEKEAAALRQVALGLNALPEDMRAAAYPGIVQHYPPAKRLVDKGRLSPTYEGPDYWKFIMGTGQEPPRAPNPVAVPTIDEQGNDVTKFVTPTPGLTLPKQTPKLTPDQIADNARLAATAAEQARHNKAMESRQAATAGSQAADITKLTPGGLDLAALSYKKTGVMPPLGMGDRTTRQQIINRAAELTPADITRIETSGQDIAGNKADYKADATSLVALTRQRDAITAFENTALKNIDLFLTAAKDVTDTGIPLLNTPARWVAGAGGSASMAKYNAARQVAISEIARIVQNPNLTGQLSDTARREIEVFNPANATLKQTVAVMGLLKQDMANRKKSLDDQVSSTRARIGASGSPKATPATIPTVGSIVTWQGKRYRVKAITNGQAELEEP